MLSYILKVTLCWSLFYLLYHLWLGKETFFKINRWYLLGTALLGLIIPAFDFQALFPVPEEPMLVHYLQPLSVGVDQLETVIVSASVEEAGIDWWGILMNVYWFGAAIALSRFLYGLFRISKLYKSGEKSDFNGYRFILTAAMHVPFSFFKNLFWSKDFAVDEKDKQNIVRHEEAHIFQWHSIDVVFFEILNVLFWCCPFIYLYKKAIKDTHEYLADDYVVAQANRKQYGRLLLRQSQSMVPLAISNSFFSSQLKNRIVMITKNRSTKTASLKYLAGIPLLAMLFLAFSFQQKTPDSQKRIHPVFKNQMLNDSLPPGEEIFKVVEEMPLFKGCEGIEDLATRKKCADETMLQYIYANIKYPKEARKKGIEGMSVVKFIIEKDGSISNAEIIRAIGAGCDEEVIRVVNTMPNWTPGKQRGKAVRVQFNLPVRFKLSDEKTTAQAEIESADSADEQKEVFTVVEEMPRFPGCEEMADQQERTLCSQTKMLEFIYKHVKYPKEARNQGLEGIVVVKFIVEKDGSIADADVIRSIGGELDEEVLKVVYMMPNWVPGKQRGKAVRTQFNLPVRFKLDARDVSKGSESLPLKEVDELPVMATCGELQGEERAQCSNMALFETVYSKIKYPKEAKEKNVEGTVYATFVVEKDGSVTNVVIDKSVGSGCDEEVKRVVSTMPKWIPGVKDGKPVAVQMVIPVKFKLQGEDQVISIDRKIDVNLLQEMNHPPRFSPCDEYQTLEEKEDCANNNMIFYINEQLPPSKGKNAERKEGEVIFKFTVMADGSIENARVENSLDLAYEQEFLKAIRSMPNWVPGKKDGKAIPMEFAFPVNFGIKNIDKDFVKKFKVYPNPSNENGFTLRFQAKAGPISLRVIDMAGRELSNIPYENYDGSVQTARFDGLFEKNSQRGNVILSLLDKDGKAMKSETVIIQ
ncbi:MAG: M56 family metallopeptidase [Bacteroidota bacterium]